MRIHARAVAGEAIRNLATGTTRALGWATVFIALVGGLAVADARVLVGVWQDAESYRSAAASVQLIESTQGLVVDGARCQGLRAATGTTAAGALRPGEPIRAATLPDTNLTVWEATPGLLDLLTTAAPPVRRSPAESPAGIWLAEDLADTLGTTAGGTLVTDSGPVPVAGVYRWPNDGRDRDLAYAALLPVPASGSFQRCWAEVWPVDGDTAGLLYSTLAPGADDVRTGRLNTTHGTVFDLADRVSSRPTTAAPGIAAACGLVVGLLAARTRRLELASALHARVPKPHLTWQLLLETGVWTSAGLAICAAATGAAARVGNPGPVDTIWATAVMTVGAGASAALVGTVIGVLVTREKHLFRYFKGA